MDKKKKYTLEELISEVQSGNISVDDAVEMIPNIVLQDEPGLQKILPDLLSGLNSVCYYIKGAIGETKVPNTVETIVKDLVDNGEIEAEKAGRYITEVVGAVSRVYLIDEYEKVFNNLLERYGSTAMIEKYKDCLPEILEGLGSALGKITRASSYTSAVCKTFFGDDYETQIGGFIDILSTAYSKVPVVGTVVGVICAGGKYCLTAACEVADMYFRKDIERFLPLAFEDYLGDEQVYANFNAFLKEKYGDNVGGEYVSELYISQETLQNRLGTDYNIDNLLPTDVFFLVVATQNSFMGSAASEAILKYLDKDSQWLIDKMDEYCEETLIFYNAVYGAMQIVQGNLKNVTLALIDSLEENTDESSSSGGNSESNSETENDDVDEEGEENTDINKKEEHYLVGGSGCDTTIESSGNGQTSPKDDSDASESEPRDDGDPSEFMAFYNREVGDARKVVVRVDPLVFDMNNDGIFATSVENGVHFDYEGDGFREKTAWMSKGDAVLVRDVNGNGIIDDGTELFGDQTVMSNGEVAVDGFEALTDLDSNNDGIVNADDEYFSELKMWTDSNADGISQTEELHTLEELGIQEISLVNEGIGKTDNYNNVISGATYAVRGDGTIINVAELDFVKNTHNTVLRDDVEIDEDVLDMPEIYGMGEVYSLRQAMSMNDNLKELVSAFINTNDRVEKKNMMDDILAEWTGSAGLTLPSRGSQIDAVHLRVIEQFYGAEFVGANGANPNTNAASILNNLYEQLKYHMYANLIFKTDCTRYLDEEDVKFDGRDSDSKVNFSLLKYLSQYDSNVDMELLKENVEIMAYCINDTRIYSGEMQVSELLGIFETSSELFESVCRGITRGSFTTTESKLYVNGDDNANYMKGTQETNTLFGGSGNDVFVTEGTSDLYGGAGNDIYVIEKDSGSIKISDTVGNNRLYFGDGIVAEDITVYTTGGNDVTLHIKDSETRVTLSSFLKSESYQKYVLEFSDGTVIIPSDENGPFKKMIGSEADNVIYANYMENMEVYAGAGNDTVYAGSGTDKVYGESGNDTLYGEAGEDLLVGETGNDSLYGGIGNDTYVFNLGDGADDITDYDKTSGNRDTLRVGVTADQIIFEKSESNLLISILNTEDSVKIQNWYSDSAYHVENVESADGYSLSHTQVDLLIQSMASFESTSGMSWRDAVSANNEEVNTLVSEMWIKQEV